MFPLMVLGAAAWAWFWRRSDRRRAVDRDLQYDCDRQQRRFLRSYSAESWEQVRKLETKAKLRQGGRS